jgi:ketosteroid isomerase-like protein
MTQQETQTTNQLKAFAYAWYARFDRGTSIPELLPFLPDEHIEFVYPSATLTTIRELRQYMEPALAAGLASRHLLHEIDVWKLADGSYELLLPHSYQVQQPNGTEQVLNIMARMRVAMGLPTALDPAGNTPKVMAYRVVILETPASIPAVDALATATVPAALANEVKAFVHTWFARIDAGDMSQIGRLVTDQPLDFDLLGYAFSGKPEFEAFLDVQKNAQRYSSHSPAHIQVTAQGDNRYGAEFLLKFKGELKEGNTFLQVNNVTRWVLVTGATGLQLQRYRLELL